jgi:hypothetical protein
MSETKWDEERKNLLERVLKAEQTAAESQAGSAVYRDLLVDCYEAARQAQANNDLSLLSNVKATFFFTTPSDQDVTRWGKYFLEAHMRDARWLRITKESLKLIKAEAEKLLEKNEISTELRMSIKKIHEAAEEGLITHV